MSFWKKIGVVFGAVTTSVPLWPYIRKALEWGEHGEFILHRIHDLRVIGPMLETVLTPALWQPLTLIPAGLLILWLALRRGTRPLKSERSIPQAVASIAKPVPDIDARDAFFRILELSEWRKEQDRTTDPKGLVYNWREVRLDKEIHKALRNSLLDAWGEECLPGTATTPEKPIPPEAWDTIKIVFDRSSLPRTAAHSKGRTSLQLGRMAWVAVKFSSKQIFQMFPLTMSEEYRPIFMAIRHISQRTGDANSEECWPATRLALRQAAYDKRVRMKGRKHLPENNPHTRSEYSELFTDVESSYWATSVINALATAEDHQSDCHVDPQTAYAWGKLGIYERNRYAELKVNWSDLLREWP